MNYYNLEQTLEVFQEKLPETLLPFALLQLADLCRRGEVTPVFTYNRYVIEGFIDDYGQPIHNKKSVKSFNGYLTLPDLTNLLFRPTEKVVTSNSYVYEEIGTKNKGAFVSLEKGGYDHHERYNERDYRDSLSSGDTHHIGINDLLFPIEQVQVCISSKLTDELDKSTPSATQCESDRVLLLETKLAAAEKELRELTDRQDDNKELRPNSEAKVAKLIYTLLAEHDYQLTPKGKGNSNLAILEATKKYLKVPLSENFIASWLEKAYQLNIDQSK